MKRVFDVILATIGLLVSAPVWCAVAAAIWIEDRGPLLYFQPRVGQGGRIFTAFKFRSMIVDAERATGAIQARARDPRVTAVGRVLRVTALDELPQLWNILRGDMSFVGPRPLRPGEIEVDGCGVLTRLDEIAGYEARHRLRPGLTGLAQVYAPRDVPRPEKFRFDLAYIERASFWLDLRLIALSCWISTRGRWEHRGSKV
jgi:lipopolysaccharide/colanic/teichoic acid biosynthesis glycosyltransferase